MKNLVLLFFLQTSFLYGQDIDFQFFETERKIGKTYFAQALIPAKIDSVAVYNTFQDGLHEVCLIEKIDTIYFTNFRVLPNPDDYHLIAEIADTIHIVKKVADKKEFLLSDACNRNKEWVTEYKARVKDFKDWMSLDSSEILNTSNWRIQEQGNYVETKKYIVKMICDPRVEIHPPVYKTISIAHPKYELSSQQKKQIEKYTQDYLTFETYERQTFYRKSNIFVVKEFQYTLTSPAEIREVEVLGNDEIRKLMNSLSEILIRKGILNKKKRNDEEAIKKAIIQYQLNYQVN